MRVLVVSHYFWPEDFRINELVAELMSAGHDVTVLTGLPNYPAGHVLEAFRRAPDQYRSHHGATILRVPVIPRGRGPIRLCLNYASYAVMATLLAPWWLRNATFDAVLVFQPSPVTVGVPAVVLRAWRRWPIVFWVLDQWPETLAAVGVLRSPRLLRWIGRGVSFLYRRSDLILTTSKGLVPKIREYAHPDARVEYFPNWVESVYEGRAVDRAPEVPASVGMFTILFAGNVGEAQDFPAILEAARRLREHPVRWVVVGDGRRWDWVRDEVRRLGLSDRVLLPGRFPIERMPSFYAHADALLVSLKAEPVFAMTLPGKVASYLAAGLPVLAMLNGEGARVVEEAKAGLTSAAGDAEGLAASVLQLSRMSPDERRAMGAHGRAYCREQFDRPRLVRKLQGWLTEVSAGPTGARP